MSFGFPALRLRGLSLGIVTLALAAAVEAVWFRNRDFTGGVDGATTAAPSLFGINLDVGSGLDFPRPAFGMLCLLVLVAVGVGVAVFRQSHYGSWAMAVRVNERAAAAAGIDVVRVKLGVFALAAFIAGLGGALAAYRQGVATFDLYSTLAGLGLFATVYLAGMTSISGGLLAGLLAANGLAFKALDDGLDLGEWYGAVTGLPLLAAVIAFPDGIVGPFHRAIAARRGGPADADAAPKAPSTTELGLPWTTDTSEPGQVVLSATDVSVTYGKVVAVSAVSFTINAGTITGLIGPNGAGKTTLLDALTGFAPNDGVVSDHDGPVDHLSPTARARRGLSRTFQSAQLCEQLSVEENLAIGLAAGGRQSDLLPIATLLGLEAQMRHSVGDLPQGTRQMVSLGRALAGRPNILLLDEPAGGLDSSESALLGERLRRVRDSGITIVLVEHDMSLVLEVCDEIIVLDFGQVIATGTPSIVMTDALVTSAYLGRTGAASE